MRQCVRLPVVLRASVAAAVAVSLPAQFAGAAYEPPTGAYDPPTHYYDNATGTGTTLLNNLHNIISVMTSLTYGDARYVFAKTDADPNHAGNILLVYTNTSVSGTWDAGVTFNREHLWPKFWLNLTSSQVDNSYSGVASDLFELRPADPNVNSARSNNPYGFWPATSGTFNGSSAPYGSNTSGGNTYWYPSTQNAGEVARGLFYMATRYSTYQDTSTGTLATHSLTLVNGTPVNRYTMGDLNSLLHWNYEQGVDNFERARNQAIYADTYFNPSTNQTVGPQGNRNPFVDHPEYVWAIFGTGPNDSQITVSSSNVDLGRVMRNGSIVAGNITFTKNGTSPTTFDLTTAGNATLAAGGTSSPYLQAGVGQAIAYNSQTRSLYVTLSSTATTGAISGSITVNNTDLTSAGANKGSADPNDVINVSASVLDKRVVTTSGTLAFGTVITGASVSGNVTLSTSGDDNHFTRVNAAGNVAADANGIGVSGNTTLFNAANSTGSRTLSGTLTGAGNKSGSLSLGITTAENLGSGLTGEGSYAALSLGYTAKVLAHSNASFNGASDVNTLTLDFGTIVLGSGTSSQNFSINNLNPNPGFTAGLDFTGWSSTGSGFATNLATFGNLAAGSGQGFAATLDSNTDGAFSQTISLSSQDQALPGGTAGSAMTLNLTGNVTSITAGNITIAAGSVATSNGVQCDVLTVNGNLTIRPNHNATGAGKVNNLLIGSDTNGAYTGRIELNDNAVAVQTTDANDKAGKIASLKSAILSGKNGGTWNGNGISSAAAAADPANKGIGLFDNADLHRATLFAGGPAMDDSSVFAGVTFVGDANFDGIVNIDDLTIIANHWQKPELVWSSGDLNLDGIVNIDDLTIVANHWQLQGFTFSAAASLFPEFTSAPEPATLMLLPVGLLMLVRRRRP